MASYLGYDVARAITDQEIEEAQMDVLEDLYARKLDRGRSLTAPANAVVHLLTVLDRRTADLCGEIRGRFAELREGVQKAARP